MGHSVLYGFYGQRNDMIGAGAVANDNIVGSQTREWGLGVVQEVDAAAMSFWLQYDHFNNSVDCGTGGCGTTAITNAGAVSTGVATFTPGTLRPGVTNSWSRAVL